MSKREILNLFTIACKVANKQAVKIVPYPKATLTCKNNAYEYINLLSNFIKDPEYSYLVKNKEKFVKLEKRENYVFPKKYFEY